MTTAPLNLTTLWHDALADTRALLPLALPIAAAFVLLPGVAIDLFGPPVPKTAAAMTPHVVLIDLLIPSLIGLVAQLAILRLTLDRRRGLNRSVGEALAVALRLWPIAVASLLLGASVIVSGLLLLILPGLYVAGRLTPAVAFIVDGMGPIRAIERSWALTEGNGWRVIGFTLLLVGWFVVVLAAVGAIGAGVAALFKSAGAAGVGIVVASTLDGAVAALFTVVNAVAVATVYRMLKSA